MELAIEFIKILLPAAAVLYAMYLTVQSFLNKEVQRKMIDIKTKNTETVTPIRLQAYERVCLFLERIKPNNLVVRLNNNAYSAQEFHQILLQEIREEYNHNLSQQVYMSDQAWEYVTSAMEDVVTSINKAAQSMPEDARGLALAKQIFEVVTHKEADLIQYAIKQLKNEVREYFY